MATYGNTIRETMIAGEDLDQWTFVAMNTTDRTVVAAGNADAAFGVVINSPLSGKAATIVTHGRVIVNVGTGGLSAGDTVGVDANGAAVTSATSDIIVGYALEDAAAGTVTTIDFFRGGNASA